MTRGALVRGAGSVVAGAVGSYAACLPPRALLPASAADAARRFAARSTFTPAARTAPARVDEVAAAAARAGLNFIILTDHGDGTREPDPPAYRSGVLCIDAVEISTASGHVVALGLPRAPYPLGGETRDVVEDVQRLGGLAIAAHPASREAAAALDRLERPGSTASNG